MAASDFSPSAGYRERRGGKEAPRAVVIVGVQWGDEGKGKFADILCDNTFACCRYNGGANAGHTVVINGREFKMHLLPSGIVRENVKSVIGNGCVVHLPTLDDEVMAIENSCGGFKDSVLGRLVISTRAHLVFKVHLVADGCLETERGEGKIGTTGRGIGPAYSCKAARLGLRVCDLADPQEFERKYLNLYSHYAKQFDLSTVDPNEELKSYLALAKKYEKCFQDNICYCQELMARPAPKFAAASPSPFFNLVIESANGAMLDLDYGTYPYVTSSSPSTGGLSCGLGVSMRSITDVVGICKCYLTRVGEGPFPTELDTSNGVGGHFLTKGSEYGVTTGRARRCGWLDIPMLRYTCAVNDVDTLMLTKLDVLSGLAEIKLCVDHKHKQTGELMKPMYWPPDFLEFSEYEPVYETLPGWNVDISKVSSLEEMPVEAINYVKAISSLLQIDICAIGVGPERHSLIQIKTSDLWKV